MTKTFIYLATALAFVSCSQNEVTDRISAPVNSDVIGFNSSTNGTRGNNNAITSVEAGFDVIGLNKDRVSLFAQPSGTAIQSRYAWLGSRWGWATETDDKKWPAGAVYPLTFIVPFPIISDAAFGPWAPVPMYVQAINIGTDLTANEDMLAAYSRAVSKPASGVVPLLFKHILSNIQFEIVSPADYTIYIQSLTIKDVANSGRTYNYEQELASAYSEDPQVAYTTLSSYIHMKGNADNKVAVIVGAGFDTPATQGIRIKSGNGLPINENTWKLMPQQNVTTWAKADFKAAAMHFSGKTDASWAAFLAEIGNVSILSGAQLELVYRMVDKTGKSVVGWGKTEKDGTEPVKDMYVKVAFPLDIASLNTNKGWEPAKQYTYQIKLGTPDATNGTVIDPNYKDEDGGNTDKPIDNPREVKPGEDITDKDGYIGFDVLVDVWTVDGLTDIK